VEVNAEVPVESASQELFSTEETTTPDPDVLLMGSESEFKVDDKFEQDDKDQDQDSEIGELIPKTPRKKNKKKTSTPFDRSSYVPNILSLE
jgi:hypothetical protein